MGGCWKCGQGSEVRPVGLGSQSCHCRRVRSRAKSDAIPLRDINSDVNLVTMAVIVAVTAYGVIGGEIDGRRAGRCA